MGLPNAPSGLLDLTRIVARPGFNRWLVPPAALAIHLCIGMAYGFSVFWLPLSQAIGITKPVACSADSTLFTALFTRTCDWRVADLGWMFTLFFVFLGSAAAIWGGWLERSGPRKAGFVAALCWSGGLCISALGIYVHQLWMMWIGSGVIGGIGLGLGYISPVSTLIKWFPDRRGMATGMAIMGFGGGAMIGSPLADILMNQFRTAQSVGVWQTFPTLAAIYFVFMTAGAFGYRVPPPNWRPAGWQPPTRAAASMITHANVALQDAHKTPQFWLVWAVLMLNVSAGIGVIGMASPIFVGLLSLFNIAGRFFWASLSDLIGRKITYVAFFGIGVVLYAAAPAFAHGGQLFLFVAAFCIILSMYGGGFATVPAYLADLFGTQMVGAIHGRLLTAWSTAGIVGPVVVNYIRAAQIDAGVPRALVYDRTLYILAGMLVLGMICNLLVRPVSDRWFIAHAEPGLPPAQDVENEGGVDAGHLTLAAVLAWAGVGIPIAWGVWITLSKSLVLFR